MQIHVHACAITCDLPTETRRKYASMSWISIAGRIGLHLLRATKKENSVIELIVK